MLPVGKVIRGVPLERHNQRLTVSENIAQMYVL